MTSEQSPENRVGFEEVRMGGQGILGNGPNEQEEECLGDEVGLSVAQTEDGRDAPREAYLARGPTSRMGGFKSQ